MIFHVQLFATDCKKQLLNRDKATNKYILQVIT